MRRVTKKTTSTAKSKQGRRKAIPLWRRKSVRLGALLACILSISGAVGWGVESGLFAQTYNNSTKAVVKISAKYGFTVQEIFVSGRDLTAKKQLLKALKLKRGTPIFSFAIKDAQKRVEKLPWVATAVVERRLPDTIMLHVNERRP
ncbi:MAG: FtsQ-type POTRA domain-containing protein, partial [Alphaproteobacteria bacterium]|nr:FtsQ-type POTRA domain-containing protein [Alphaproteobacteria bacterium]